MRFSKKGIAVLRLPSRRNTLRPIERPLAWLAGLALALCAGAAAGAAGGPSSVAFWYAERPPLAELSQFDWVVLEAAHLKPADVGYLKEQGSTPFAYLSVGEFDGDAAAIADSGLARGKSAVRNQAWNSQVMDLAAPSWRAHLLKRAAELRKQGYAGLFLDTLDSFQLQAEERREASAGRWPVSSPNCIARSRASSCFSIAVSKCCRSCPASRRRWPWSRSMPVGTPLPGNTARCPRTIAIG
ncbi:PelA protein [Pseudomonas aeruginosa]|nr:PelA protein [Pseudomonas aeruginosa]